jgi:hypothetical protein
MSNQTISDFIISYILSCKHDCIQLAPYPGSGMNALSIGSSTFANTSRISVIIHLPLPTLEVQNIGHGSFSRRKCTASRYGKVRQMLVVFILQRPQFSQTLVHLRQLMLESLKTSMMSKALQARALGGTMAAEVLVLSIRGV